MGLIDSIKGLLARRGVKEAVTAIIPSWASGKPNYNGIKFEELLRYGWRQNELIHACISKTAHTAAQVELKVYSRKSGDEVIDHPLKQIIQKPNPQMTEYDFWAAIIINLKLAGKAYFEKERDRGGRVIALWPLRPDWVREIMQDRLTIKAYEYIPGGVDTGNTVPLAVNDVLVFRAYDPGGLYSTWPPVAVVARSGDIDNDITDMYKAILQEGGMPPGILTTKARLTKDDVERLRAQWKERYGGWRNWLEPAILDSEASYQKIAYTAEEMGMANLDARVEARICMALDVPPILVGAKIGLDRATYSNYEQARQAWWEDTLIPMYADLLDTVQNQLLPEYDSADNVDVRWDLSRVPALQPDRNAIWANALEALRAGAITVNEFRGIVGMDSIESGDVFLRGANLIESKDASDLHGEESKAKRLDINEMRAERDRLENEFRKELTKFLQDEKRRVLDAATAG